MKRSTVLLFLTVIMLFLNGCAIRHDYAWKEYPIESKRISSDVEFSENQQVAIVSGKSNSEEMFLGNVGAHQYFGNEQLLTDGLVEQLTQEFQKRGLTVNQTTNKSLDVAVTRSHFERGMWKIAVTLDVDVLFGDGKAKTYTVRNSSPTTVDHTYNGAVALAVIEIINDPELLAYISR